MHILITNDDGIDAPGLAVLENIARTLDKVSKVTVVAPKFEQSGFSHAISYKRALSYEKRDDDHFLVPGTPADCVLLGIDVICDTPPDLVLSGVNSGNNAAQNTLYSGTVGATIEAAFRAIPAIALSQFYGPNTDKDNPFEVASQFGQSVIQQILDYNLWQIDGAPIHYNVNFPPVRGADLQGSRLTTQGTRDGAPFFAQQQADGEIRLLGTQQSVHSAPLHTDIGANMAGFIAITPCGVDLTHHSALETLKAAQK